MQEVETPVKCQTYSVMFEAGLAMNAMVRIVLGTEVVVVGGVCLALYRAGGHEGGRKK